MPAPRAGLPNLGRVSVRRDDDTQRGGRQESGRLAHRLEENLLARPVDAVVEPQEQEVGGAEVEGERGRDELDVVAGKIREVAVRIAQVLAAHGDGERITEGVASAQHGAPEHVLHETLWIDAVAHALEAE